MAERPAFLDGAKFFAGLVGQMMSTENGENYASCNDPHPGTRSHP
jgi:hypothetical protein